MKPALTALLALAITALGCGDPSAPTKATQGTLPEGVVARVGAHSIDATSIARVAAAQNLDPAAARDAVVRDALLAAGAEQSGLAASPDVTLAVRATLARRLARDLARDAAKAPITDDELAAATARKWLDVARPEASRTVHALVRFDEKTDEPTRKQRLALAEKIRAELQKLQPHDHAAPAPWTSSSKPTGEPDPLTAAFERALADLPRDGAELVVQPLPPVTIDGRVLTQDDKQRFAVEYARAAAALQQRGDLSPIVTSPFGAHVIMLLERIPARELTTDERRAALRDEIFTDRARAAETKLLEQLRGAATVSADADALLALIVVDQ